MIGASGQPAQLAAQFGASYGCEPAVVCRAPGRVNLIGEHTDYNDGFVLPAAINLYTWVAAAPREDGVLAARSAEMTGALRASLDAAFERSHTWTDYVTGVVQSLRRSGVPLNAASLLVRSEVPLGAGLSSSAALEMSVACSLLEIARRTVAPESLARICQLAENEYVGAPCGIMDQFVAGVGRAGNAVFLDCRSLQYEYVPLPADVSLVLCNSMVKHSVAGGEYGKRRAQCEEAVDLLRAELPGINSLRDVTREDFERYERRLPEVLRKRARHVITENERVRLTVTALRGGDLGRVGGLMRASHESLRDDYEVSCPELDLLVELARAQPGVLGARMTGGGFGGCTVNLVRDAAVETFREVVARNYERATGRAPAIYVSQPADGVQRVI
jgi:galactokinase